MKVSKLAEMKGGWFVGSFQPTLLETEAFEVGCKHYRSGDREPRHHHRVAVEFTVVAAGRVRMNGAEYAAGDVIRIEPGESTDFEAVEDTITVVVKVPSAAGDKYPG